MTAGKWIALRIEHIMLRFKVRCLRRNEDALRSKKRFLPGSGEHSPEPGRKRSLFKAIYFAERSACIFFPR